MSTTLLPFLSQLNLQKLMLTEVIALYLNSFYYGLALISEESAPISNTLVWNYIIWTKDVFSPIASGV